MHMVDPNRRELFILSTVTFDLLQVHKKSYKVKGTDRFSALPSAESRPLPWRPTRPARLVFPLSTRRGVARTQALTSSPLSLLQHGGPLPRN